VGTGEGDGELVRSITLGLDCPGDGGGLEGNELPGELTIDGRWKLVGAVVCGC
jgi:hypothetical protein